MKDEKLVSVIIPTFGRPDFLLRAIESVVNQSYKNIEILIVDDNGVGSIFQIETINKIETILTRDKRVRYIKHEININGSAARNTGIKNAGGDYICFLDDDDEFDKDKILLQVQRLEQLGNNWVACYTGHKRVLENIKKKREVFPTQEGDILYQILMFEIEHVGGSSLMIRKDVFDSGILWNEKLARHQDFDFIAKVSHYGKVAVISTPLLTVNIHGGSYRQNEFTNIEKTRIEYMKSISECFKSLTQKQLRNVMFINYFWLFKKAIQYKEFKKMFYYFGKSSKESKTSFIIYGFKDLNAFIKKLILADKLFGG